MKFKLAAVLEPKDARFKEISAGLTKAGLKVSSAREVEHLRKEDVVVLGALAGVAGAAVARGAHGAPRARCCWPPRPRASRRPAPTRCCRCRCRPTT